MDREQLSTGTTTCAIVCTNGVVMGADRRVTAGHYIMAKDFSKIWPVANDMVMTVSGVVSDVQLISKHLRAELKLKTIRTGRSATLKEAANLLATWAYSMLRNSMGVGHYLLGGRDCVYDVSPDGALKDHKDYVASGSGSVFALGVLENDYKKDLTVEQGIAIITKALNTAMQRDSASGNGFDIYVIDENGARHAVEREIDTNVA